MRTRSPSGSVRRLAVAGAFLAAVHVTAEAAAPELRVGSKSFTESYLVAEIVAQIAEHTREARVERALGLGGTGIAYGALATGSVEMYLEYTGTISRAILKDPTVTTVDDLRARLKPLGLTISDPLGFANTYALAVRRETADRLGIRTISDLRGHPAFTAAFDPGFLQRDDGWPGLSRHYGLTLADVRGMEHALTYQALSERRVDVIDVFSTDGRLARGDLRVLADDRHFFPDYAAVLFLRASMPERLPRTWALVQQRLVGKLDTATMVRLNALVDVDGRTFAQVAATFLGSSVPRADRHLARDLAKLTVEHLLLVLVSLVVAVAVGLPLGLLTTRGRRLAQLQLAGVGVLQTIPALALLAFMIPLFGIGRVPALVALSLYALLPIVRNVHAGVSSIDPQLLDVAAVMRLRGWRRLLEIEIPLASVTIMAGIKTAAVSTVGTATLAAFIGGGGYGTPIVTGLALNDVRMILSGAIPAALMALVIHAGFELLDRAVVPLPLRARSSGPV
jgi:osmoprotectant transport system permease protein